ISEAVQPNPQLNMDLQLQNVFSGLMITYFWKKRTIKIYNNNKHNKGKLPGEGPVNCFANFQSEGDV
ncbi:hypothetical protein ACJX0J_025484, partial [Zea mays]